MKTLRSLCVLSCSGAVRLVFDKTWYSDSVSFVNGHLDSNGECWRKRPKWEHQLIRLTGMASPGRNQGEVYVLYS